MRIVLSFTRMSTTGVLLIVYGICWVILCLRIFTLEYKVEQLEKETLVPEKVYVKLDQPEFLLHDTPEIHLMDALEYYGIQHKEIVYAQAVLETGNFKSRVCKEYKNLFGLYNSYKGDYYRFNHWTESVVAYLRYIQYRYTPPRDYYEFLDSIGYAEDPYYTRKLRVITGSNKDEQLLQNYYDGGLLR